ncbi:phosphotransferase [Sphaerisporangium sp. NPDC088356]|uniref:phosphotransferase n=1 Tax=Sphaerisporangium sp. NPDC088356 TaxID=3154871 RepID=UPI003443EEBA
MYLEPEEPGVAERMRTAHSRARAALCLLPEQGTEAWGWRGRTLSRPVLAPDGPAWLRIACAPTGQADSTFWDGSIEAENAIPGSIPRPRLRYTHDWSDGLWKYRAELFDRLAARTAAESPTLLTAPDLPPTWWTALRAALDDLVTISTHRFSVSQQYLDRAMPRFLGAPIDTTAPSWSTAHGDFHWANICAPTLHVLDWEGWGLAPTGYDAAVLHSYSLLVPSVATRVRTELAHVLNSPAGQFAELAVITQLLHTTTRGDNLDLAEPLRNRATHLLGRAVPLPAAG